MSNPTVRQIVLASRPNGPPKAENFRLEEVPMPPLPRGGLLLRVLYLSLDPYMRGRMDDAKSYAKSVGVGEVMTGESVCEVLASDRSGFSAGDIVLAHTGWRTHAAWDGPATRKLDPKLAPITTGLGVLGMPGFTAYAGLNLIGKPKPGETVVVAAASGPVGALVGQLAKMAGARAVGVAGGAEKCRYVVEDLRFDVALDHRASDFPAKLAAACPKGIDVYFENVGGAVFDAVLPLFNERARMTICGLIAHYGEETADARAALMARGRAVFEARGVIVGDLFVGDFVAAHEAAFLAEVAPLVASGALKYREDLRHGLESVPAAFSEMLHGANFGKTLVQVSPDPTL